MLNTSVFLINISSISTELFSELLVNSEWKAQTSYEIWHNILYAMSRTLVVIKAEEYIHIVDNKKVKLKNMIARFKKMTVIDYRDSSIYHLYNRKKNEIIFSTSVCLNEKNMLTSSFSNKNLVIDSSESFDEELIITQSHESSDQTDDEISTSVQYVVSDHSSVRKFVNMRKQWDAEKKKNKNKENNNALSRAGISSMWWEKSKKNSTILNLIICTVKLMKIQNNLLLSQNNKFQSLTLALLVKLDDDLFNNDNIWFQSSKDMKIYSIIQQQ